MRTLSKLFLSVLATSVAAAPLAAQGYGSGVAIHSGQVLIAETGGATSTGVVYVYEKATDGWTQRHEIRAADSRQGGRFGTSLSLSGHRMLVGSPGTAYVFELSDGHWTQTAALTGPDLPDGMTFGGAGTLVEDVALITASGPRSRRGGTSTGKVFAFKLSESGWTAMGEIVSPEAAENDGFGTAIITNGSVAAIGAPGATVSDVSGAGAVYFFELAPEGSWVSVGEPMVAPDPSQGARFGASLEAREGSGGAEIVVGATGAGRGVGAVYSFAFEGESPALSSRYFPPVVGRRGGFGSALAFVDGELWIGGNGIGTGGEGQVLRYAETESGRVMFAHAISASNANAGDGFGERMAISDDVAVIVAGGKDFRFGTAYVFEREGGNWVETSEIWSEAENYAAINGHEVGCEDGMSADFDCGKVNILSFMPVSSLGAGRGARVNDVWGWTDPQTGREYALLGLTDQASFIDITDATNPRYLGKLPMTEGANGSVWRDIKVYENHAFIVSDGAGQHGMQVFNLARLRDVGNEPVTFDMDAHYDGISSAHNIVINESSGFAYSVGSSGGGETCGGGLHMIDIREPTEPTFAGCFADAATGRRLTGYSHDAQCIEYDGPDTEHVGKEICFGSNETAISIADVSDKQNPVALSSASYPDVAYAHQGWVTDDHKYFYLGDELDELQSQFSGTRTMIFDITDLDDPILVKQHFGESTASDHNMYVAGDLLYQSNYNSGMRILDISDPENPSEVGFLDTVPYAEGPSMGGSWSNYPYFASGTIIVTSGNEGLFMVKYDKPELVP